MLEHGGDLRRAAEHYQIPLDQWVDLSTGINPNGWKPKAEIPADCWQRLPEEGDGLEEAATNYYGSRTLLPVAGSQAAIQTLPSLWQPRRIGVISPGYAEHTAAWNKWGHEVIPIPADEIANQIDHLDGLLLINPCNPSGESFTLDQLLTWHQRLYENGAFLLVDEAFIDPTPELSLISTEPREGLIVLRSLGKFFGLAGLRVGFVHAVDSILTPLQEALGPWPISGPARWMATQALNDQMWHLQQRHSLMNAGERLKIVVADAGFSQHGGTALFRWFQTKDAESIQAELAAQGVWVRRFGEPSSIRLGLPATEAEWQHLESALNKIQRQSKVA